MRRLAILAFACAGCLRAPEGRDQAWPPSDAPPIGAVVAADLDGDGAEDVVAIAAGLAADGAGVYVARGETDVTFPAETPIASFSAVAFADLEPPVAAAAVTTGSAPDVDLAVAHVVGDDVVLTLFSGDDLAVLAEVDLMMQVPPQDVDAWMKTVAFGGGTGSEVVVAMGDELRHSAPMEEIAEPIPPPEGQDHWTHPNDAATFMAGTRQILVAAEDTTWRSNVPTPPNGFDWQETRATAPWVGQVALDLTGDDVAEIIGFSTEGTQAGKLCVLEVAGPTVSCLDTTITADMGIDVRVETLTPDPNPDVVIVEAAGNETRMTLMPNLTFTGGTAATSPPITVEPFAVRDARIVTMPLDAARDGLLLVAPDGTQACAKLEMTGFGPC